ncbi:hypothetical protein CNY89_22540 [Amaricoccus sp. HAR-UPW-R2A-40]|nr:hypothetical protein CNY89_22540 [Amaricoccus sp. HAR-UPW-R2A-40]
MAIVERDFNTEDLHPIDIVESLAEERSWDFDRIADDQIAMAIEGAWSTIPSPWPFRRARRPCA